MRNFSDTDILVAIYEGYQESPIVFIGDSKAQLEEHMRSYLGISSEESLWDWQNSAWGDFSLTLYPAKDGTPIDLEWVIEPNEEFIPDETTYNIWVLGKDEKKLKITNATKSEVDNCKNDGKNRYAIESFTNGNFGGIFVFFQDAYGNRLVKALDKNVFNSIPIIE